MQAVGHYSFEVGLALSGAISAGAYTAGVLDFLFQALDEWEKVRGEPSVPNHRVGLKVVTGASAGAITGALGVVALARGIQPQPFTAAEASNFSRKQGTSYQTLRCVLPSLYDTWVTNPCLVAKEGGMDFLSTEDLRNPNDRARETLRSLLNARLLDAIKEQALRSKSGISPATQPPYDYIAEKLHVYMTVSNLRGIPFTVAFGNSTYGMQTHGDRIHYAIDGLGAWSCADSSWVAKDRSIPLSIATLPPPGSPNIPPEWDEYGTCALASSAFPLGLASREIVTPIEQYEGRQYPMSVPDGVLINPKFPETWFRSTQSYVFQNVDGGVINNNPFDYAQYALMGSGSAERKGGAEANAAVIMISPFPEPPAFLPDGQPLPELVNILRALFPALINQARFKASELAPALDKNDRSRFLIAPHRKLDGKNTEERCTIACGLLGGFGGFLDEKFRAHDFQLGRRNCQRFLQHTLSLPGENPLCASMKGDAQYQITADPADGDNAEYAIVPLLGSAAAEVALPNWPRFANSDFNVLITRVKSRISAIAPILIRGQTASPLLRSIGLLGSFLGSKRVVTFVRLAILSDLIRRDQIEGWELPSQWRDSAADDVRAILAELASPAYDFRTVAGISSASHLGPGFVTEVLNQLTRVGSDKPFLVWQTGQTEGERLFTLASRKPTGFWSLPLIKSFGNWLEPPTTDRKQAGTSA